MKQAFRAFSVLFLFLLVGEASPRLLIADGFEAFDGERQAFAGYAWTQARLFFSGSMEPLFWTAIRVQSVDEKTGEDDSPCRGATVRAYTLFGLPWSSVRVSSCDGGSIVRQEWGLARWVIGRPPE